MFPRSIRSATHKSNVMINKATLTGSGGCDYTCLAFFTCVLQQFNSILNSLLEFFDCLILQYFFEKNKPIKYSKQHAKQYNCKSCYVEIF